MYEDAYIRCREASLPVVEAFASAIKNTFPEPEGSQIWLYFAGEFDAEFGASPGGRETSLKILNSLEGLYRDVAA